MTSSQQPAHSCTANGEQSTKEGDSPIIREQLNNRGNSQCLPNLPYNPTRYSTRYHIGVSEVDNRKSDPSNIGKSTPQDICESIHIGMCTDR